MAAPLEDQDEFALYQEQRRQRAQAAPVETDEFTTYQQSRRNKKEKPRTGKDANLDRKNENIRITQQAARALREQADAERKARVRPVEEAAGVAGRAQLDQGPVGVNPNVYLGAGSEFMLPPDAQRGMQAEREVYRANDVTSSLDAATLRGLNSMAFGLPAMLNKDFRGEIQQAGQDQPGASMAGDIAGYLVPGALVEAGVRGVGRAVQPLVNRFAPTGGSMLERGTRLGGRTVGLGASGATQSGVYQGSVGESVAAAEEGRDPSIESAIDNAISGATDPAAILLLPAFMAANRIGKYISTGGATSTPDPVARSVSASTGGRSDSLQSSASSVLGMDLAGDIRPQAVDRIVRTLSRSNMSREDITRLFESVQQRISSLPEAQARRLTLGQAMLDVLENPEISQSAGRFTQAAFNLRGILRGAAQGGRLGEMPRKGDERAGIVAGVRGELQRSQSDFVMDSARQNLGDPQITDVRGQLEAERNRLSGEYDRLFQEAGTQQPLTVRGDDVSWSGAAPMEPQGLLGFIRSKGGLKESFGAEGRGYMRGTVQQILGDVRSRPGLLNNKTGQTIDELTSRAQEAGFDIRDDDEFVRLLADELQGGSKTYRIGEAEEWEAYQSFLRSRPKADAAFDALPQEVQELSNVVSFYISKPSLMKEIRAIADAEMIDLEQMVQQDPRRAAHWLQRAAREKADEAKDKGNRVLARAYGRMRTNLLGPLERAVPGYRNVRGQYGSAEEIDRSLSIGRRFLSKTERPEDLSEFVKELNGLSPEARSAALASIRDEIGVALGRGGEDASARISQLTSVNALRTLEALGPEGKNLADDLRFMRREQQFIGNTIYGSDTFRNLKASESEALGNTAATNAISGQGGMGQALATDAMFAAATQTPVPLVSGFKAIGQGISNAFKPRVETLNDEIRFLMGRRGNVPERPGPADFSAPQPAPTNAFSRNERGSVNMDVASGLVYGGVGAFSGNFVDYNQDGVTDQQDMLIGAGVGAVGGAGASRVGSKVNLPKGKGTRWDAEDVEGFADRVIADAKPKPITRVATEDDLDDAITEAVDMFRQFQTTKGKRFDFQDAPSPRTAGPDDQPMMLVEEMAAQILRSRGIDPDPVLAPRIGERFTNAESERFNKALRFTAGQAKAAERQGDALVSQDPMDTAIDELDRLRLNDTKPNAPGLGNAFAEGIFGGAGGSALGSRTDLNGDGVIDEQDVFLGSAMGTVGVPAAMRAGRTVGKPRGTETRAMGFGADEPSKPQGHAGRVSTRVPFAKGPVEDHLADEKLTISTQQFRDDPKLAEKAQAKIHTYSGFSIRQGETPMETVERFQKQVTDNLLFLYDNIAEDIVDRSRQWYNGARKVVNDWTTEYQGLTDTQAASVIAALSPQNEWNNNVSIAKRVIDIFMNKMDTRFSSEMEAITPKVVPTKELQPILNSIRGKTLAEAYALGDFEAGMWIRLFDEAYGDRGIRSLSPEGNFGDYMRTGKGEPTAKRWNSFAEVAKAVSVLRDPSPARISDALGQGHKVRNFYNNILDPDSQFGDVTIDTHAAAAAHLRPFSSKDEIAVEAMRGIGHAKTGSSGLYGLYADAYREAAKQRGVLPREMQSVTWEAVKTLFTPSFKAGTKRSKSDPIRAIWLAHEAGDISADEARRQIFKAAGGIDNPNWAKSGPGSGRNVKVRNENVETDVARDGGPRSANAGRAGSLGRGERDAAGGVGKPSGQINKKTVGKPKASSKNNTERGSVNLDVASGLMAGTGAIAGGAYLMDQASQPQDARFTSMAVDPARSPQIAPPQAPRPIDTAMRRVGNVANDAAASLYGQSEIRRIENAAARGRAREFEAGQQMEQMRPPANASENAVARLYAPPPAEVSMKQADNPLFFGVESFDDLSPNDPLRDPWFRREMIKRSLRDQAYQKAQGRTVGKPKEKRTVGKARAN